MHSDSNPQVVPCQIWKPICQSYNVTKNSRVTKFCHENVFFTQICWKATLLMLAWRRAVAQLQKARFIQKRISFKNRSKFAKNHHETLPSLVTHVFGFCATSFCHPFWSSWSPCKPSLHLLFAYPLFEPTQKETEVRLGVNPHQDKHEICLSEELGSPNMCLEDLRACLKGYRTSKATVSG